MICTLSLRLYSLPSQLSSSVINSTILPFLVYVHYCFAIKCINNITLNIIFQSLSIFVISILGPLHSGEIWILIYVQFIMVIVTSSGLSQTLRSKQILEEQTLHMSAILMK